MRSSYARTLAVAAVAAAALTACGSGGGSSGSSAGSKSSSPAPTLTGSPINVMSIYPDGTNGANFPEVAVAAQAYQDYINGKGGINGHPLKVTVCNDSNDANKAANCARQAVSMNAAAVIGSFTLGAGQVLPVLAAKGIPYLAGAAIDPSEYTSPYSYPILSGPVGFAADGVLAGKAGCKTTDVVAFDLPTAAGLVPFVSAGLGHEGKTLGKTIKVPVTTTDYSSVAQSAKSADCVVFALPEQAVEAYLAKAASLGSKQRFFVPAGAIGSDALKSFGTQLEGSVSVSSFPAVDNSAWSDYVSAVKGKKTDTLNPEGQNTWVGYVIFTKIATGLSTVDGASIKAGLDKATALDTGGLTPPLNFTKTFPVAPLARLTNTQLVELDIKNGTFVQNGGFTDFAAVLAAK